MKNLFVLLFLATTASAQWIAWPSPTHDYADKAVCELAAGRPCFPRNGLQSDEVKLEAVDIETCEDDLDKPIIGKVCVEFDDQDPPQCAKEEDGVIGYEQKCTTEKVDIINPDPVKIAAKQALEDAATAAAAARRLKLAELKAIVESKDPSAEELRDALKLLLEDQLTVRAAPALSQEVVPNVRERTR